MAKLYNLAAMTVASTGTGPITLGTAATIGGVLYLTFALAGAANGETIAYSINDSGASEVGTAVYNSAGPTITRTPVTSTNGNLAINVSPAAIVRISPARADIANLREVNAFTTNMTIGGTLGVTGVITALSKGHTIGSLGGPNANTPVASTDANILLYPGTATNWAGIGVDTNGAIWFRTGISGTPVPALWISNTQVTNVTTLAVTGTSTFTGNATFTGALNTFAGQVNIAYPSPQLYLIDTTPGSFAFAQWGNGTGTARAGVETTAGGALFVGTTPNSAVFGSPVATALHLATNNTVRMTIASGGAVTISNNVSVTNGGIIVATAKSHLFGNASGTVATGAVAIADANILLYNFNATNWAGIGSDANGSMWFKVGISGTPSPALYLNSTDLSGNFVGALNCAGAFVGGSTGRFYGANLGVGTAASPGTNASVSMSSGDGTGTGCIFYFTKNNHVAAGDGFWIFGHKSGVLSSGASNNFVLFANAVGSAWECDATTLMSTFISLTSLGTVFLTPLSAVSPAVTGQLAFQSSSANTVTLRFRGADAVLRQVTLTCT